MGDITIDASGQLKLPPGIFEHLGRDQLSSVSSSSGHLFLCRPQDVSPVLMAGILEEGAIPDLLSFYNMFRKTGVLSVQLDDGVKDLYFQEGEIVFATSTDASEDLGEMLFALGKIEHNLLHELRPLVTAQTTIGKLLVDRGAVSPKDLWLAARSQVENIVYNLFAAPRGGFYFQQRDIDQEQILRLSMSTQNLIMEGLRRLDERALFMRKIISLDYYPMETGAEASDLSQGEAAFMKTVQMEQATAAETFRLAGLREFEGMRTLYGLLERRLLRMEDSAVSEVEGVLGQVLLIYNSLFMAMHSRVIKTCAEYPQEIAAALRDLPQPYSFVMRDVELREDGTLDGHRIVTNLDGLEEGDKNRLLADALCEVAFMKTMALRRELEAEQARPLIARVQEVAIKVREIVGSHQ